METVDELLTAARAETGLDDFGDDSFLDGLERLVDALATDAMLSDQGRSILPLLITNHLSHRLQIEDWYRRHPEIDDEQIVAPLIGLGLPRTGSTALSFLLAEDPHARSLRQWEANDPCPPPSTVDGPDPRIAAEEVATELQMQMAPGLASMLPASATGPMECQPLMALSFASHMFQAFARVPSYSAWLRDADLTATYEYEKRVLKLLQWGCPAKPWRLKCPSHLLWLDALDRVFPDARFVMTHRDPAEVLVSVADLYGIVAAQFSDHVDLRYIGQLNLDHWSVAMQRLIEFRSRGAEERFFDLSFRAVQRDPLDEVRRLYEWLGEPVTDEFASGMARWWTDNAATREPNVHPPASAFGLDPGVMAERFRPYREQMETWLSEPQDSVR
jgi:hypothetical protein